MNDYEYNNELRKIFVEELSKYKGGEPLLLPFETDTLKRLIFVKESIWNDNDLSEYYSFALEKELLKKIDFTNIPFDNVFVCGMDFTGIKGIKINPQTVYHKNLCRGKFNGVEFIGSFDGTQIEYADFTGSKGAKINPQTLYQKSLRYTNLCNTEIIGTFDGVDMTYTKTNGCNQLQILKQMSTDEFRKTIKKFVLKNNKTNTK